MKYRKSIAHKFLLASAVLLLFLTNYPALLFAGEAEIKVFREQLMPRLLRIAEIERVEALPGESIEDVVATIYSLARRRGRFPILRENEAFWTEQVEAEVKFMASIWSWIPWVPKSSKEKEDAILLRRQMTHNGFNRVVAELALEKMVFTFKPDEVEAMIKTRELPPADVLASFRAAVEALRSPL